MENRLNGAVRILAKLTEVGHWLAAAVVAALLVMSFVAGPKVAQVLTLSDAGTSLSAYGFDVEVMDGAGQVDLTALRLSCGGMAVILGLMAMVFRNVSLIMKRSKNSTPFQKDNIRMVREIGIFLISIPIVGLLFSTLLRLILGADAVEASIEVSGFMVGLVALCLSRVFAQGMELEADVDGLL